MLEDVCSHDIKVLNLTDGEVVKHSVLLIRGKIINHRQTPNCFSRQEHPRVTVYNGTNYISEFCKNGEFKFIFELPTYAELIEGEVVDLELHFKYCTTQSILRLQLKKPVTVYRLQPIYILCADEIESNITKTHCEKIDINLRLVQAIYADRIREALNCTLSTFALNGPCRIFRSQITREKAWSSDEDFLWSFFAEELLEKHCFEDERNVKLKIVAFIGCTKYDGNAIASGDLFYGNIRKHLKGYAALGGGDLALFGSCFFYAWPSRIDQIVGCLENTRKIDQTVEPDESNYRRTYLGVYATTLGAVCHELGHIFNLAHTEDGIMGSGFDYLNRLLTISNRTENLPKRIIGNAAEISHKTATQCRLTRINRDSNGFLDSYRKQKTTEFFFFTRNCALILAYNKWFQDPSSLQNEDEKANITFDAAKGIITCNTQPLKIVEIRATSNSLVEKYFELPENTFTFQLEWNKFKQRENTHYLFVMTLGGESSRFDFLESDNENSK